MEALKRIIRKIDTPLWLEIFFVIIFLLRIPSFFEPYHYGDETIYLTLGEGIRRGIPLYLGLHDNKPPLLYLTAAIAGNLFWFKVFLAGFNLTSIYLFWKIVKHLIPNKETFIKVGTVIFGITTTIPMLEGNIANAENFMIVPTLLAFYVALTKKHNFKNLFLVGILFSIATLFKIVAAFDIVGLIAFWLIFNKKKDFVSLIKKVIFVSLGFIVPLALTFIWYFLKGGLNEYITAAFLQNIGYVSSWRPSDIAKPFIQRNFPLIIRGVIMLSGFIILYLSKKKLSKPFIFSSAWLLASLFAVTLSERPYPHYLLQVVPSTSILLGIFFTFKNMEQILSVIPLALMFFVPFYYRFWYYPTYPYYQRFINFAIGRIDKEAYFSGFSGTVQRNYEIAEFLNKSTTIDEKVFVWSSDASTIYSLARRFPPTKYVADYHFIDFSNKENVLSILEKNKPKFIVITSNSPEFKELSTFARDNYYLLTEFDSAEVWLMISPD